MGQPQRLTSYPSAPGQCISCGNAMGRDVIDTGCNIDFYGAVLFCWDCAILIGTTAGLVHDGGVPEPIIAPVAITKEEFEDAISRVNDNTFELHSLLITVCGSLGIQIREDESSRGTDTQGPESDGATSKSSSSASVKKSPRVSSDSDNRLPSGFTLGDI